MKKSSTITIDNDFITIFDKLDRITRVFIVKNVSYASLDRLNKLTKNRCDFTTEAYISHLMVTVLISRK